MKTQFHGVQRLLAAIGVAVLVSACSGASVTSAFPDAYEARKLTSPDVVWTPAEKLPVHFSKSAYGYHPVITTQDRALADFMIMSLVGQFQTAVADRLRRHFPEGGASGAPAATIEVRPVRAGYIVGGSRALFLTVSVKEPHADRPAWQVTIRTSGLLSQPDSVLLDNFVNAALAELRKAGWLG